MSASVELTEVEESLILSARKKTVFRQADSVDGVAAFFISQNFHEKIAMMNDSVAIARAAYEAYVKKDRAAIEALLAQDFHFTSPLDNRLDRATSPVAGRTAPRSLHSISFTSFLMESGSSSPTRVAVRPDTASEILKLSPSAAAKLSMSKCILAGQCRTRRPSVDLSTKNRPCRLFAQNPPKPNSTGVVLSGREVHAFLFIQEYFMNETRNTSSVVAHKRPAPKGKKGNFVLDFHGVRYQIKDVSRSVAFYTAQLGFKLKHQQLPAFANVSLGKLDIFLSGPGASGSRRMPDGNQQEPGGWNRVVFRVPDLEAAIETLKDADIHFRNDMEVGPAGKQIQFEDPDGNTIELFEPARKSS